MSQKSLMQRRSFLFSAGVAATTTTVLPKSVLPKLTLPKSTKLTMAQSTYRWRMLSRWDAQFPNQFVAAQRLANRIAVLSGGRLTIEVLPPPANEPAENTLKAVQDGSIELCRSLAYHWRSQSSAFDFFFVAPFGFTQDEMNTWLRYFGGQELWDEAYAPLGVKSFPAGALGAQSFGWFRQEITNLSDLKNLRFRTTGLGVDIMKKLGVSAVNLPPNQIIAAMRTGEIDAFELVGPQVDLQFGAHQVAPFYYFPSYNQPSGMVELVINKAKYDALPEDLQQVIAIATQAEHDQGLAEANAGNAKALKILTTDHNVQVRQLPQAILMALGNVSSEVLAGIRASGDSISKRTIDSFQNARQLLMAWSNLTEQSFLTARALDSDD
jgi:TRAP-type mannitol/chloroaromatic compound transport system substrate-binding protein